MKKADKFRCPCCGEFTLDDERENSICPVCGWEDDWWDSNNPDEAPSCNWLTLNKARELYKSTGMNILEYYKKNKLKKKTTT